MHIGWQISLQGTSQGDGIAQLFRFEYISGASGNSFKCYCYHLSQYVRFFCHSNSTRKVFRVAAPVEREVTLSDDGDCDCNDGAKEGSWCYIYVRQS
jgi:hypothetical protein